MLDDRQGAGTAGDADTGHPGQEAGEQPTTPSDSLFNVPEGVTLTPQMQEIQRQWESSYTKKRQQETAELRQEREQREYWQKKAQDTEAMLNDPDFWDGMLQQSGMSGRPQAPAQTARPTVGGDDWDTKYGEGAPAMRDMVTAITSELRQGLTEGLQPIIQDIGRNRQQSAMADLKTWAEENGYPNPDIYQSKIAGFMRRNPNATYDQAYRAVLDLSSLPTRKPVEQPQGEQTPSPPPPIVNPPSGNRGSATTKFNTEASDPVAEAIKLRREGRMPGIKEGIKSALARGIQKYNEDHGTNVTASDLE